MTTEVSICNLALARLGDGATVVSISPPEGSAQAEHCARFYPLARDACLEDHAWKFATVTAPATLMASQVLPWAYVYAEPSDSLRLLCVIPPDTEEHQPYAAGIDEDGQRLIYTNQAQARLQYVKRVVNPSHFPALFVDALSWLLASFLAGPMMRDNTGRQAAASAYQAYLGRIANAKGVDANQQKIDRTDRSAPWVAGR